MLDLLSSLLGFPFDDEKSVSVSIPMLLLGVDVAVRWADKLFETVVANRLAALCASELEAALETRTMGDWLAEKMAGRLSFAVTASGLRVGRAFVKPFLCPGERTYATLPLQHGPRACHRLVAGLFAPPPPPSAPLVRVDAPILNRLDGRVGG